MDTTTPTPTRDEQILARQFAVMQRQILDLTIALARAEAINQQLVAEHQQLRAELDAATKATVATL